MKKCSKCGEFKPLDQFYTMAGMRDGYRNDCKACNLAAKAARYATDPEPARERARRWALEHPTEAKRWRDQYRESGKKAVVSRRSHLKRTFGLTEAEYDQMMAEQGDVCAICGDPPIEGISLHVDHDHATGRVRRLLCVRCNNGIALFREDPGLLLAAVAYLRKYREPAGDLLFPRVGLRVEIAA